MFISRMPETEGDMNRKKMVKTELIASLFFLALGGWLLHLRIHPLANSDENLILLISGIISVFCLSFLFWFRPTVILAYLINGFSVIIGAITMAHFSIAHLQWPISAGTIILNTTFADIVILWGKFAVGKALFELEFLKSEADAAAKGRFFRYPNMGWWWVHLFVLAIVYALGNILWE